MWRQLTAHEGHPYVATAGNRHTVASEHDEVKIVSGPGARNIETGGTIRHARKSEYVECPPIADGLQLEGHN